MDKIDEAIKAFFNRDKRFSYGKIDVFSDGTDTKLYYNYTWILCLFKNKNILLADYFPEFINTEIYFILKRAGIYTTIHKDYLNLVGVNLWFNNNNIEDVWFEPIKWTNKDTLYIHMKQDLKNNEGESICRSANIEVLPRDVARSRADSAPREVVIKRLRSDEV